MQATDVVRLFIRAINDRDVEQIVDLCTADHAFVDAHGNVTPTAVLTAAWRGYFDFMPVYGVEAETMICEGDTVAVFGSAWGALNASDAGDRAWRRPCAWRARVRNGKLALWQTYVDTKAVFDLL